MQNFVVHEKVNCSNCRKKLKKANENFAKWKK